MINLAEELQSMYDSGINIVISCFRDGGWTVAVGDEVNGLHKHEGAILKAEAVLPALQALIKAHYPKSAYASSLMA